LNPKQEIKQQFIVITFQDMGLSNEIMEALKAIGFEQPTPIQEKVIPALLEHDSDVIGLAQTGTGKTAAFGIPVIERTDVSKNYVQSLILSPTRELCLQISEDLANLGRFKKGLRIVSIYGGASIQTQIQQIRDGAHIVVATPGRMIDMLERRKVDISNIHSVVLDEADEMLNMGFREDLTTILATTPSEKRTLMFSATMSKEIAAIASNYMKDPMEIMIGRRNEGALNVQHVYYMVNSQHRYEALKRILDSNPGIYGIVFCRTRQETKDVSDKLMKDGYNADALHGDLSQAQRDTVMGRFRQHSLKVLVATDVAARGIDVDDITHVINYNLPDETEVYTHRSGRTGRAGKKGTSIVIIHSKEQFKIKQIEKLINRSMEQKMIPGAKEICEKQLFTFLDRYQQMEETNPEIEPYLPVVFEKLSEMSKEELIKRVVSLEFSRLLDYYKNAPDLNVAAKRDSKSRNESGRKSNFVRMFINVGTMDRVNKPELIGIINEATGDRTMEIGKIEILPKFAFFEVPVDYADKVKNAFRNMKMDERKLLVETAQEKQGSSSSSKSSRSGGYQGRDKKGKSFDDRKKPDGARKNKSSRHKIYS
jgi:ATP-dependent RNA helicase DeaD